MVQPWSYTDYVIFSSITTINKPLLQQELLKLHSLNEVSTVYRYTDFQILLLEDANKNIKAKKNITHPHTCSEVIEAACPSRTASGAHVCKHHTLIVLSQDPAAIIVFS